MADDADISAEHEETLRAAQIQQARRVIPIHERPILDCIDCNDISQNHAKEHCADYAACLSDWEREQRITKLKGK